MGTKKQRDEKSKSLSEKSVVTLDSSSDETEIIKRKEIKQSLKNSRLKDEIEKRRSQRGSEIKKLESEVKSLESQSKKKKSMMVLSSDSDQDMPPTPPLKSPEKAIKSEKSDHPFFKDTK